MHGAEVGEVLDKAVEWHDRVVVLDRAKHPPAARARYAPRAEVLLRHTHSKRADPAVQLGVLEHESSV